MTIRDIAVLACRLMGLWVIVQAFSALSYALPPLLRPADFYGETGLQPHVVTLAPPITLFITGVALWGRAAQIGQWVSECHDDPNYSPNTIQVTSFELQGVLFSFVGLYIAMVSLSDVIVSLTALLAHFASLSQSKGFVDNNGIAYSGYDSPAALCIVMARSALQTGVGLWVMFGARSLAAWVQKAGRDPESVQSVDA
jgi:hypothetical protein